jgi:hypothetical protein
MTDPKKGTLLTSYDPSDIIEAEIDFRMEAWQQMYDEEPTREQLSNDIYKDSDVFQMAWDDMVSYLTDLIKEKNPNGYWSASVVDFGWRNSSGHAFFKAVDGASFLRSVLPKTDNTFFIYKYGKNGFAINNFHHDSPTGREWYYIRPSTKKEIEEEEFRTNPRRKARRK